MFLFSARVAANGVEVGHGYVEFVVVGIFQQQKFLTLSFDSENFQAFVTADAVFYVHDRRAYVQFGEIFDDLIGTFLRLFAPPFLLNLMAKQFAFGDDGNGGFAE